LKEKSALSLFLLTTNLTIFAHSSARPSPFRVAKTSLALRRCSDSLQDEHILVHFKVEVIKQPPDNFDKTTTLFS